MELTNRVAIVTGGGRGIGNALALALAREGSRLVITSRTDKQLKEVEAEITQIGAEVHRVACDLEDPRCIDNLLDETLSTFGPPDILINNAALLYATPLLEVTEDEWDQVMQVNSKHPFSCPKPPCAL